jgi:hypothetical protein
VVLAVGQRGCYGHETNMWKSARRNGRTMGKVLYWPSLDIAYTEYLGGRQLKPEGAGCPDEIIVSHWFAG